MFFFSCLKRDFMFEDNQLFISPAGPFSQSFPPPPRFLAKVNRTKR